MKTRRHNKDDDDLTWLRVWCQVCLLVRACVRFSRKLVLAMAPPPYKYSKSCCYDVSHITEEVTSTMGFSIQLLKYAGSLLAGGKYLHKSQKKCHTQEHKSRHRQGLCEEEAFFFGKILFSQGNHRCRVGNETFARMNVFLVVSYQRLV